MDQQLEKPMNKLVHSDILARASSMFHFKGLDDPIFGLVFRRLNQAEVEGVDMTEMEPHFEGAF